MLVGSSQIGNHYRRFADLTNAAAFRHLFGYHFQENRQLWDNHVALLSPEQFIQEIEYAHASVRGQIVHLLSVDEAWFSDILHRDVGVNFSSVAGDDRPLIRAYWDDVERMMRHYLATVTDEMLFSQPSQNPEDKELYLWQILLQIINHGTDHRAQILRMLNDMGIETISQDYIFYAYDNPPG